MRINPSYKEIVEKIVKKDNAVLAAYIFGSHARGTAKKTSDVDIAILFDSTVKESLMSDRQLEMTSSLSQNLNKEVDVVILNRAATLLKYMVLREGKRVYERPGRDDRSFEVKSMNEYYDFLPIKNMLDQAMIKRIKKARYGKS
jgi:hypothetical protein